MGVVLRGSLLVALAGLLAACFAAPPPISDMTDGTSGASCFAGEQGCACFGNGTCEAGLECNADVHVCIPERCVPGELACVCADGECITPHVCAAGVCTDADGGTESSADSSDPTSASTSETVGSESSGTAGSTGTTSDDDSTTHGSSGEDSSGGDQCAALACDQCVDCVDDQACAQEHADCELVNGCASVVECLIQCAVELDCFDPCCEGLTQPEIDAANALFLCKSDKCLDPCSGLSEFEACPG